MSGRPRLEVAGLHRRFGGLMAVRDVSLELGDGEILGLIGPNGSGKSTLLSMIAGRLRPTGGRVRLGGRDVTGRGAAAMCRDGVGCTFQLVHVPDHISALDNVAVAAMFGRRHSDVTAARLLARKLLDEVEFAANPDTYGGALTYADQKRVELARALATWPDILLLDEWLAGLTPTELHDAIALIRRLHDAHGLSIIVVEHVMAAIRELCRRVVVLSAGEVIASGSTDDCLRHPDVIAVYLGEDDA